ncbi:MAG: TonB-dependent receptor, partial [Pseudomonadota bacterium]
MSMSTKMGFSVYAAALLALSPAWSQDDSEQQSAEARVLGTVLVTAQKREENLQDVPIAITALGADDLERLGVETAAELTEFVSNVELGTNGDGASQIFIVRGVGLQDFNANNTPTTALIADDVYLPYNIMAPFTLFDMDRIEILKGPQGGLYGRNSTGGAISFVSNKATPGAPASYNASAEIGNYGSYGAKLAGSVPIGDYFAVRLAAQFDRSDGYYENTFLDENVGGVNRDLFRGTLSFEPTSTFNADLRLTYGRDRSEASIPEVVGTLDPNVSQPVIDLFGLTDFFPAFNIPYTEDLSGPAYCPSFLATGIPGPECINMARITPDGDPYKGVDERVFEFDDTFRAASLTLNWDAGPVTLVSISSWADLEYDHPNGDGVVTQNNNPEWAAFGGSGQLWQAGYTSQVEAISQEVRVLSNTTEPFNWILGASYHQDDFSELRTTRIDENLWWNWLNFPGGGQLSYDQKTEAYSVYGQVGFDVTDRLALVVDARLTDETKDYVGNAEVSDGDLTCLLFEIEPADCVALQNPETGGISLPVLPTGDFPPYTSQYDEQVVSWKVSLDYALERGGIAYFSVGEGFKSGGIFGGFLNTPDELEPYKPEKNLAYEVGLKTRFFDDTVQFNGAVFFYDYKDWQDNLTAFSDAGAAFS